MYYCNWYEEVLCRLCNISKSLSSQSNGIPPDELLSSLDMINCSVNTLSDNQNKIYSSIAANNPMTVAAEYPNNSDDKLVYTTEKVRFLDMLNPRLVILFKGVLDTTNPVYFADTVGYEHIVTSENLNHHVIGNELINNIPYQSLYVGNYIILNPSEETISNWMNGTLS